MDDPEAPTDDPVTDFLLRQPGFIELLLREHRDRGDGYCGACPGPQSGRRRFPCNIRLIADRASEQRRDRTTDWDDR